MGLSSIERYALESLRKARAAALSDAEAFPEIFYALERVGTALTGRIAGLDAYKPEFENIAAKSPLASGLSERQRHGHTAFERLYDIVRTGRNEALHHGAFARHLTRHAVELCLLLEDGLMSQARTVADSMVRDPVCAELWQPLSIVRQQMLANSFSYLPVLLDDGSFGLIGDLAIARALSRALTSAERRRMLACSLGDARASRRVEIPPATTVEPEEQVQVALERCKDGPLLVLGDGKRLLGIVTPFDML